jgi:N-formylmaleamate deformylase
MFRRMILTLASAIVASPCLAADSKPPFKVEVTGSGPPIILIPGLTSAGAVWEPVVAHLKGRYECHVLTLAGFAGQPPIEGPFLDTMRDGIAAYIKDKKLNKPVLVGHSLGGYLVFAVGSAHPELVGPLVAVDGLPCAPAVIKPDLTAEELKRGEGIGKFITAAKREDFLKQQKDMFGMWVTDPKKLELLTKWSEASDQATVGRAMGELWSRDLRPEGAKIKAPVLLVGAAPDAWPGVTGEEMQKRYKSQVAKVPDATVVFAAKAKHFIMFDEPDWLNKQIDEFLKAKRK